MVAKRVSMGGYGGVRTFHDHSSESLFYSLPDAVWDKYSTGRPGPPYKGGDRFWSHKSGVSFNPASGKALYPANGYYQGDILITPAVPLVPVEVISDDSAAQSEGAHAWDRARQNLTAPEFSWTQDLFEIKETLDLFRNVLKDSGRVWRQRDIPGSLRRELGGKTYLTDVADHNLGFQFGVLPLVSDVMKYIQAMLHSQEKAQQIMDGNGRTQKVQGRLHNIANSVTQALDPGIAMGLIWPALHPFAISGELKAQVTASVLNASWYSGNFTYYLPDSGTIAKGWGPKYAARKRDLQRWLYNDVHLSPKDIYDLIPWSWLLDYFSEAGHVFGALSHGAEESMYADNFFVMNHSEVTSLTEATFALEQTDGSASPISVSCLEYASTKARAPASPFGFGINPESLTDYQVSIMLSLAARRA